MQTTLLSQILVQMERPLVVLVCTLVVLAVRFMWMGYRRKHPLIAPAPIVVGKRARRGEPTPIIPVRPPKDWVMETIDTLLIALILVFGIVRPYLLQTFYIPSESMIPTLLKQDKLIANKFVLRFRLPERGEIIVFQPPREAYEANNPDYYLRRWLVEHPKTLTRDELVMTAIMLPAVNSVSAIPQGWGMQLAQYSRDDAERSLLEMLPTVPTQRDDYVKRAIGLPGDYIRIADDRVYRNGKPLDEPYLTTDVVTQLPSFPAPGPMPRLHDANGHPLELTQANAGNAERFGVDFLNWVKEWYYYQYLYLPRIKPYLHNGELVVPPNAVMMMGDHRTGSFDSRFWGFVPRANIKARAVNTFWPLDRLKLL